MVTVNGKSFGCVFLRKDQHPMSLHFFQGGQTGKKTTSGAVRETGISRHNGGPIEAPRGI